MFKESFLQTITPNRWCRLIEQKQSKVCDTTKKLPNGFCQFIISCLHCCPASSGSIDRVFSTFGLLWSRMRNALGSDRVQKLVETTRLGPYMIVPTHDCAQTVPTHDCAHTRLCPDSFVPTHVCAQTRLCPHTFVPTHVCAHTCLYPNRVVTIMSGQKRVRLCPDML